MYIVWIVSIVNDRHACKYVNTLLYCVLYTIYTTYRVGIYMYCIYNRVLMLFFVLLHTVD